ncbi:MAG: hypothetical protein HY699_20530 [Deltaproteobacteria bacterium]|nr:hypothetical protein [Deltaproteobacteria bacterium]
MLRFSYRVFLWIFALANSVVWFFLLYGLALLVHEHFADAAGLARTGALAFFALTPFVSAVLASQGAIVNLRAQYLVGRFTAPPAGAGICRQPANPWFVSLRSAPPLALAAALVSTAAVALSAPAVLSASLSARAMGGIGAAVTLAAAVIVADREFRRFHAHLGAVGQRPTPLGRYLALHFAAPWTTVNGVLNGIFAWMLYREGPGHSAPLVSIAELRFDLTLTAFLISVFTALAVIPEVETDFAAGLTPPAHNLPAMPPVAIRLGLALALAGTVWVLITLLARLTEPAGVPLSVTIGVKAAGGAGIAALAAIQCARWTLARCQARATVAAPLPKAAYAS